MTTKLILNANLTEVVRELSRMVQEGTIDPSVRKLAEQITIGQADPIGMVFVFVTHTFPYQLDPINYELFIHPRRMVEDYYQGRLHSGDCDDHALLNAALLGSIGYKTRIILVDNGRSGEINHALSQVETKIGWVDVDTTSTAPLGWFKRYDTMVIVN